MIMFSTQQFRTYFHIKSQENYYTYLKFPTENYFKLECLTDFLFSYIFSLKNMLCFNFCILVIFKGFSIPVIKTYKVAIMVAGHTVRSYDVFTVYIWHHTICHRVI